MTFWPSLMMGAIVLLIGQPMLMLFGEGFAAGYSAALPAGGGRGRPGGGRPGRKPSDHDRPPERLRRDLRRFPSPSTSC